MVQETYLQYDPLKVFAGSMTPAGLYARQKWRGEKGTERWISDFNQTVGALRANQLANGSWDNSEIITIRRLFGLHLTVREADDAIERGLDWLLGRGGLSNIPGTADASLAKPDRGGTNKTGGACLNNLPFSPGCFSHFAVCAGLFLANCFGWGEERKVTRMYNEIAAEIESRGGRWCSIECTNNAIRAFVTHERYGATRTTSMMVDYLGGRQLSFGNWAGRTPFFMTFNALAHLDSDAARGQCTAAAKRAAQGQNKDGSWGRTQKEWNTFLVVHALKRLKIL